MKEEILIALHYTLKVFVSVGFILLSMVILISWGDNPVEEKSEENNIIQQIYKPETTEINQIFYKREDVNSIIEEATLLHFRSLYNKETNSIYIASTIAEEALSQDVPINLAFAIAKVESNFRPHAINYNSHSIDYGLFQLNDSYRDWSREDFFDIRKNTREGISYLGDMLKLFDGDVLKAVAAYNCGPQRVLDNKIPESTRMYVTKVMSAEDYFNILFNDHLELKEESIVFNEQLEDEWTN